MSWQQSLNTQRSAHGPLIKEALDNAFGFEHEPQRFHVWYQLMRLLMRGHQPTIADLAAHLQLPPSTVAAVVDTFPSTEWAHDNDTSTDRIVGSLVTSVPTRHAIALIQPDGQAPGVSADVSADVSATDSEGVSASFSQSVSQSVSEGTTANAVKADLAVQPQLYAWCAFDAPLLAELMVAPIRLRTLAAGSDNPIVIDFYPGGHAVSLGPVELSLPRKCAPETPLRNAFCQRSQVRVSGHDGGPDDVVWVSLTDAAGIAQDIATRYRALLR